MKARVWISQASRKSANNYYSSDYLEEDRFKLIERACDLR